MKNTTGKRSFLQSALVLTISTFFVKIAGLLFTIAVQRALLDSGMGVFYSAYNIYNLFAVLASAGLPVAVSRMISETLVNENHDEAQKIYKVSARLFLAIGAVVAGAMLIFGDALAKMIGNPDAGLSIRVLAVTAFCAFIMSALRGYFQGHNYMKPTAVSQVIEAFVKLGLGLAMAILIMKAGGTDKLGSAGAIIGVSVGAVIAVVYLLFKKRGYDKGTPLVGMETRSTSAIVKELFRIAVPVSLGASVMSVVNVIDDYLIMNILQDGAGLFGAKIGGLGYLYDYAKSLNGIFGNAKKIFNLPSAFIVPFTVSILPVLTAAYVAKNRDEINKNLSNCFKYSMMIALPSGVGMIILAKPIYNLLYKTADADLGAAMLAIFGIAVILYALVSISGSILQAFGKVNRPLISLVVGGVVKCVLTAVLVSIPEINIKGAPIATCVCYVVMIVMNMIFLRKFIKDSVKQILLSLLKTALAAAIMGGATYGVFILLSSVLDIYSSRTMAVISMIIMLAVAVAVYFASVFLLKVITPGELKETLGLRGRRRSLKKGADEETGEGYTDISGEDNEKKQ
ncbi:MAG: polysaccharide biosynthesis protein [Clostridia bacterium]|nr:polysaccharide biosynthesis protein [Clostridia bacterium]